MDIRQLNYFMAIVEEGNISAAAKRLHISQPPLSMQLKLLEQELGTVLLERGSRRVTLTDSGRLLYKHACQIVTLADIAKKELENGESLYYFLTGFKEDTTLYLDVGLPDDSNVKMYLVVR